MRAQKREGADWGFRVPTPGWHTVCFQEGVDLFTNETSGKQSVTVPAVIDEGGADDGIRLTVFCPYKDDTGGFSAFGEQKLADVLSAVNLFDKFEEKFPGDVSLFEAHILEAVKIKVPGCFAKMKVELSKDSKYSNIVGIAGMKADTAAVKPEKPAKSTGKQAPADW